MCGVLTLSDSLYEMSRDERLAVPGYSESLDKLGSKIHDAKCVCELCWERRVLPKIRSGAEGLKALRDGAKALPIYCPRPEKEKGKPDPTGAGNDARIRVEAKAKAQRKLESSNQRSGTGNQTKSREQRSSNRPPKKASRRLPRRPAPSDAPSRRTEDAASYRNTSETSPRQPSPPTGEPIWDTGWQGE